MLLLAWLLQLVKSLFRRRAVVVVQQVRYDESGIRVSD